MQYYDLGNYKRPLRNVSEEANLWFNRGLLWTYAYNHEEAIACFRRALQADSGCVLAHWGIAYALGPNYNKPWEEFEEDEKPTVCEQSHAAIEQAQALLDKAGDQIDVLENGLIQALVSRYPHDPATTDYSPYHNAYADAMRSLHQSHSEDLDICALFAEALMNRTPWQLWNLSDGKPSDGADTLEAIAVLEKAFDELDGAWDHPGLLHMYIHLMEMSPHPERALKHGDKLATLAPDAGHLVHMGTHIDVLCGDYAKVVAQNHAAIIADRKFLQREGSENFYSIYRCHNYHFKIYGALFLGQPEPALQAAEELMETLPSDILRPLADWFEGFIPMKQHVLVRFGRWEEILQQSLPDDAELYCVTTAMMRYARTVAQANLHRIAEAEAEAEHFNSAKALVPASRTLFNNTCLDILAIAEQMMNGELQYHKGNHAVAFEHLRKAVKLDDQLPYDEPWGWMQPVRHALGALLLEQGDYSEAEAVYRADLGLDSTLSRACQHPGNVWSLHGLHECLSHRGETVEKAHIKQQLDRAVARASVPIEASCFCRQSRCC